MGDLLGSPYVAPLLFSSSPTLFFLSAAPLPFISSPFLSRTTSPARREEERGDSPDRSKGQGRRVKGPWLRGEDVKIERSGGFRSDSIAPIRETDSGSSRKHLGAIRRSDRGLWLF